MLQDCKKISWGSVIAGLFTVIAITILLSILGTGLGFSIIDPYADSPTSGVGMTFLIWSVVSFLISIFLGGYVAGRLAASTGAIHGFLVWATTLVLSVIFSSFIVVGMIKIAGATISAAGSIASGAASITKQGVSSLTEANENLFADININSDVDQTQVSDEIRTILQKTDIPTLQPDYLKQQLSESASDVKRAVKLIALNPNEANNVIANLSNDLKKRSEAISSNIDKESVVKAIQKNTNMNSHEAETLVNNYLQARENIKKTVMQRLDDAQQSIEKAKVDYKEFKEKAKEKADGAATQMVKIALWSFIALLIGAILSSIAGCCGVKHSKAD